MAELILDFFLAQAMMATTARLPVELYRDIVAYVADRHILAKLLLVSTAFHYEAERTLYCHVHAVDSNIRSKSLQPLLSRLEADTRVASLVRSLALISAKPFPTGFQCLSLRRALIAMSDLESFEISAPPAAPEATLGFIMKGVKFGLRSLRSNLPLRYTCMTFLSTQTDLVELELTGKEGWFPSSILTLIKLPSLESLSFSYYAPGHFGAPRLVRLRCEKLDLMEGVTTPSLKVFSSHQHECDLHRTFPNLVFLEIGHYHVCLHHSYLNVANSTWQAETRPSRAQIAYIVEALPFLPFLVKVKVHQQSSNVRMASEIFCSSASVQAVEIHPLFHPRSVLSGFAVTRSRFHR